MSDWKLNYLFIYFLFLRGAATDTVTLCPVTCVLKIFFANMSARKLPQLEVLLQDNKCHFSTTLLTSISEGAVLVVFKFFHENLANMIFVISLNFVVELFLALHDNFGYFNIFALENKKHFRAFYWECFSLQVVCKLMFAQGSGKKYCTYKNCYAYG